MMTLKTFVFLMAIAFSSVPGYSQSDSIAVSRSAMLYADSFQRCYRQSNWNDYLNICYPGVIKYYGGKQQFREFIERSQSLTGSGSDGMEALALVQLLSEQNEWQCVVKKTVQALIDGRPASVVSYLVGQSKDGGRTWKFVDVAHNSAANIIYIMPDIFTSLNIPQRQIIFEKDGLPGQA